MPGHLGRIAGAVTPVSVGADENNGSLSGRKESLAQVLVLGKNIAASAADDGNKLSSIKVLENGIGEVDPHLHVPGNLLSQLNIDRKLGVLKTRRVFLGVFENSFGVGVARHGAQAVKKILERRKVKRSRSGSGKHGREVHTQKRPLGVAEISDVNGIVLLNDRLGLAERHSGKIEFLVGGHHGVVKE